MPTLSEYTNVYNTALVCLAEKGYQLWYDEESALFYAERDGWDFASESPCGLLGIVTIYELKNPSRYEDYWWRADAPELYGSLPDKPSRPFVSVMKRR